MTAGKEGGRRRWPFVLAAVAFGLLDLFMILVLIMGALDNTDTDGKAIGMIIVGVVVVVLSWLTWLCLRGFVRRGGPENARPAYRPEWQGVRAPRISAGRRVGGFTLAIVFFAIAAIIAGVVITQIAQGNFSGLGGGVTGAIVCAAIGSMGLATARTPSAAERARFVGELGRANALGAPVGLESPYPTAAYSQQRSGAPPAGTPSWLRAPIDPAVTYREAMSELPVTLLLACLAATAVLIWGMTISPPAWMAAVIAVLLAVPLMLLVAVVIFLPYGIRLADGMLSIGAQGVPRVGRGWKRQEIPLAEVLAWTVCRRKEIPAAVPRSPFADGNVPRPATRKGVGNWGNFIGPGVRHVLVVSVDPSRVPAAMPAVVLMGAGAQATTATAQDCGVYLIGTRHPQRLARALENAVPGRQNLC